MPVLCRVIWPGKGTRKVPISSGMEGEGQEGDHLLLRGSVSAGMRSICCASL